MAHPSIIALRSYLLCTRAALEEKVEEKVEEKKEEKGGKKKREEKGTSLIICLGIVKVGHDNNADNDFDDGADDLMINDAFDATTVGFTYDAECARCGSVKGNLTDDGPLAASFLRRFLIGPESESTPKPACVDSVAARGSGNSL